MRARDAVLLLISEEGEVQSAVLVKRDVLEQNPELLQRLRKEAEDLYDCSLVLVNRLSRRKPEELSLWLREMNPDVWEESALWAISSAVDKLSWDFGAKKVVLETGYREVEGAKKKEFGNLGELLSELDSVGREAWDAEVPVAGGGPAFEYYVDSSEILFDRCRTQLRGVGWLN